ncbi:NADH-quinone oxidoreductase subunit F [Desulfuromonas versatilis]|uniref:NADH-quinone oxidoreductase subunit F n=1 Tax=Desulfuromonas versatilis TaxID=2802975 RepID=A0ABN6E080_9BACT|nr:NADH-quinone oxidoreductase subunit NuoF [Desulfuromonas versatilis]BCR05691.1 NADH-quinone oxidoreductase subunit F [Desulfuromonas versatilis]
MSEPRIFFNFPVTADSHTLAAYRARGGYRALEKALGGLQPADIEAEVKASGLRGRGGAGFPTGMKWSFVDKQSPTVYLCCNADEGEPGTFKDRWIFEHASHQLIEGMLLAAYALRVRHAFIYIRGEFDLPLRRLREALEEARAAGLVGEKILGSDFSCDIIVHRGAGAYVCGEESSLLTSLEGFKAYPRNKPPFPAVKGLYQAPTVINNVETLATVPWIVAHGGAAYAAIGTEKNSGTRLFGISGHVNKPGLYERATGYPLSRMIFGDAGGIRGGKALKAVIPGGSSTPILRTEEIDAVTLDAESVQQAGSMLGSGGIIVIAEGTCMVRLLQVLTRFYRHESCGQCTPCREGSALMDKIIARIAAGRGHQGDLERLEQATKGIMGNTVCALGDAASMPVVSFLKKFRDEFAYFVDTGRSMFGGRLEV